MHFSFGNCTSWEVINPVEINALVLGIVVREGETQLISETNQTFETIVLRSQVSLNNTTVDNFTLRLNRSTNGTHVDFPMQIPILDLPFPINVTTNNGVNLRMSTEGASYGVTFDAAFPTLPEAIAGIGVADANISTTAAVGIGLDTTFNVVVSDGASVGNHGITGLSIDGASGIPCTFNGAGFAVKGFIIRDVNLLAFGNTFTTTADVVNDADLRVFWRGVEMFIHGVDENRSRAFFVVSRNPASIKLLETTATGGSSQASTATIEEVL